MHEGGAIPILSVGDVLVVGIQVELRDELALRLGQDLAARVAAGGVRGIVIDLSAVQIVDSFLARILHEIAATTAVLAARTVVAGIQPAVAMTLVEMGLTLPGLRTARDLRSALDLLDRERADANARSL